MEEERRNEVEGRRDLLFEHGAPFAPVGREEIVGLEGVLTCTDELAGYLRSAADYARHGARVEPGIVFHGPPGTGKTLVARYLATICGALFINVRDVPRPSDRITATDVADIFRRARDSYRKTGRPVLLLWDEFDEHASPSPNPREREVLSQLRAELDGVAGKAEGVLLVGCTNAYVDEALVRPGRMSRLVFNAPDCAGKALLLERALARVSQEGEIDTLALSELFAPCAPASEVAEAVADAWFHATRRGLAAGAGPYVTEGDVRKVLVDRAIGMPPPWTTTRLVERRRVAVHELGHALVALAHDLPVVLVTVRPGSIGPGMMMLGDAPIVTVEDQVVRIAVGLGSTAAERCAGLGVGLGN